MATPAETRLQRKIKDKLRSEYGIKCWKNAASKFSEAGLPDIMGVKAGRLIAIEVKVAPNKPTALQLKWIRDLQAEGAAACVAYGWDEVVDMLKFEGVV